MPANYTGNPLKHTGRDSERLVKLITAHARKEDLFFGPKPAQDWDYATSAADIIADVMHTCDRLGVDAELVLHSAAGHYRIETAEPCLCGAAYDPEATPETCAHCGGSMDLVSCAKCGARLLRAAAIIDQGTGPEAGREFAYCSQAHMEAH